MLEAIFPSTSALIITIGVLAFAEFVYVLFGFGAGLIAVGTLALVVPEIRDVVVLLLLVNLPAEIWIVRSSWADINWSGVTKICVGIAVGVPLGTWILSWGEPRFLLVVLGGFLIATGFAFLILRPTWSITWPRWIAPLIGTVSGVLAGLFGTGGPPVIVYYQLSGTPKSSFRGNLMAIFLVITLVRIPSCAITGLLTAPRLMATLVALGPVLAAAWLGNRIHIQIEEVVFRRMVSVALVVIGVLLVV